MKEPISSDTVVSLSRERTRLVYKLIERQKGRRKLRRAIEKLNVRIERMRGEK